MIITVTEIGVFKRCRRMWDYQYVQHLVPVQEAPYFRIGRLTHRVLAEWTEHQDRDLERIWAEILADEIQFFGQRYFEIVGANPSEAELDDVFAEALLPHKMVLNYKKHWHQPLPDGFKLIQSEQTCMVDMPEIGISLEGTLDGLVLDEKTGRLFVLERKTYEARPRIDTLENNEQFTGYSWIMSKLFPDYEIGGVLYDGLWKRETPPRNKDLDDLFFRQIIMKSQEELDNWEQQFKAVASDMSSKPKIYPNRVWQGCWDDKTYERLCTAQSKGDDFEYIRDTDYGHKQQVKWFEEEEEND